jgi:hypothetical protein
MPHNQVSSSKPCESRHRKNRRILTPGWLEKGSSLVEEEREGKAPLRECKQHQQRSEPMNNTQILQRPVYSDEQQRATLRCPQCGRTKVAEVAKY